MRIVSGSRTTFHTCSLPLSPVQSASLGRSKLPVSTCSILRDETAAVDHFFSRLPPCSAHYSGNAATVLPEILLPSF